ncbi:intermembrane phospholipid transport protein YdbH family protein [Inquilinus limosus]|uniref:intermembrane phospholipid transport protein YdbH family protein n=1 Tax=Inquilinus limosus TaxID=171674 RepID=UPI0004082768|nr:YdbH domain-containing protein [Inquilinus limosus]
MARFLPRRRWAIGISSLLTALVGLAIAARWLLPGWVETEAVARLRAEGVPVERLTVSSVDLGSAEIGGVAVADGRIQIDRISLGFNPWTLIREGRLSSIALSGVSIRLGIDRSGTLDLPRMEVLTRSSGEGGGGGLTQIPFQTISVRDSTIVVDTPWGRIRTPVEADGAVNELGRLVWSGRLRPAGAGGVAQAKFDLTNTPQGQIYGGVQLEQASFRSDQLALNGVSGWIAYGGERESSGEIQGALTVAEVERGAARFRDFGVQGHGTLQRLQQLIIGAKIGTGDGSVGLQVQGAPQGEGTNLALQVAANNLGAVAPALGFEGGVTGKANVNAWLTLRTPGLPSLDELPELLADGFLRVSTDGVQAGTGVALQTGQLSATIDLSGGTLTLAGSRPWKVAGRFASGKLSVDLDWLPGDGGPQRLEFSREGDTWWTRLAGATKGNVAGFDVAGSIDAELGLNDAGQAKVRVPEAVLDLDPFEAIGLTIDPGPMTVTGETTDAGWTATLSGSSAIGLPGKEGGNATARGTVRVDTVGQHLTVRPVNGECLSLDVPAQDFTPRLRLARPAAALLCPDAGGRPLLETDLDSDRPPLVRAAVPALALDLSIGAGADATRLTATTPVLAIAPAQPDGSYRLTAADGKLALPDAGLSVEDVDAEVAVVPGAAIPFDADLTAARLAIEGDPVVPMKARMRSRLDAATDILSLEAELTDPRGRARATGTGQHDLTTGDGGLDLVLDPVRFRRRGLQPKDVVPALAGLPLTCVAGRMEGGGRIAWGSAAETAIGLRLRNAAFGTPWGRAEDATAELRLDRFSPLRLPAGQRVRIGRFLVDDDMPPLTDLDARFGWSRTGGVDLRQLALDWTGAKITVEGGSGRRRPSVLRIEGLDLARAVAAAGLNDVRATGIVDGTIPFRLDRDTIVVENGVLATRGPGEIRYGGASAPDEIKAAAAAEPGMDTLMTALRNFQYQSLRATLDGRSDGEANVKLAVRGSNPDLYGGFPIALNVNLSGALYPIARRSLALARIGDRIRDYYLERLGSRAEPPC